MDGSPVPVSRDVLKLYEERYRNWSDLATIECVYRNYRFNIKLRKSDDPSKPYSSSAVVYSPDHSTPTVVASARCKLAKWRTTAIQDVARKAVSAIDELVSESGVPSLSIFPYPGLDPVVLIPGARL